MPAKSKEERRQRRLERWRKKKTRRSKWYWARDYRGHGDWQGVRARHVDGKVAKPKDLGGCTDKDEEAVRKWFALRDRAQKTGAHGARPMKGSAPGAPAWTTPSRREVEMDYDDVVAFLVDGFHERGDQGASMRCVIMDNIDNWHYHTRNTTYEVEFSHTLGEYIAVDVGGGHRNGHQVVLQQVPQMSGKLTLWAEPDVEFQVRVPTVGPSDLGINAFLPACPEVLGYKRVSVLPLHEDSRVRIVSQKLWCTECGDCMPDDDHCEHIWWCPECHGYGGPGCELDECEHDEEPDY